jgi:hypothetical protein
MKPRSWKTRADPFARVSLELRREVEAHPDRPATQLFATLQKKYSGQFSGGLRTLQRRVRIWRPTGDGIARSACNVPCRSEIQKSPPDRTAITSTLPHPRPAFVPGGPDQRPVIQTPALVQLSEEEILVRRVRTLLAAHTENRSIEMRQPEYSVLLEKTRRFAHWRSSPWS